MDELFGVILAVLVAVVVGFIVGGHAGENSVVASCDRLGTFYVKDKVYTCEVKK